MLKIETCNVACLSMHKTGSSALLSALQNAGFPNAFRRHFVNPATRGLFGASRPESALAGHQFPPSGNKDDQRVVDHPWVVVTCVRDPIAQMISTYFQLDQTTKEKGGAGLELTHAAFVDWFTKLDLFNYTTWWLDINLTEVFGFDFRRTGFDRHRRSIRFDSDQARILCLRFEDPQVVKQMEIEWLIEHQRISLPRFNITSKKANGRQYVDFVESFSAPQIWLSKIYDAEAIKHFYSSDERDRLKRRWSSRIHVRS